jgi:hypothetical protein
LIVLKTGSESPARRAVPKRGDEPGGERLTRSYADSAGDVKIDEQEYGSFRPIIKEVVERLRVFFKLDRRLPGDLCRSALRSLNRFFEIVTGSALRRGQMGSLSAWSGDT